MNIELSEQTAQRIELVFGSSDTKTLRLLIERLADNEQLLRVLANDEVAADEAQAIQAGISDVEQGRVRSLVDFDIDFRGKNGFKPKP